MATDREAWEGDKVVRREDRPNKPRYLLPNGKWYNYTRYTPERHRQPYPNLRGEILGILSGPGINRTKSFVLHTLRARGKYRYIIDEVEIGRVVDDVRSGLLGGGGTSTRFVNRRVYDFIRRRKQEVVLGGIRFINVNIEDGLNVSIYSEVWGELTYRVGEHDWEGPEEFRYFLWWNGGREKFYRDRLGARAKMKESYETQVRIIKTKEIQEEDEVPSEDIKSEDDEIEVGIIWSEFKELRVVYL